MGGSSGEFFGVPTGTVQDFLGTWNFSWDGPIDANCPCRGTIRIEMHESADGAGLVGFWKMKSIAAVLRGPLSFDQNVWAGRFAQADDNADFPMRGYFRIEVRDARTLIGSYHPDGTAIPFAWHGTRD